MYVCFYLPLWGLQKSSHSKDFLFFFLFITLRRSTSSQVIYISLFYFYYFEAVEIAQISLPRILEILFYVGQLCANQAIQRFIYQSFYFFYLLLLDLHCGTRKIKDLLASYSFRLVNLVPETQLYWQSILNLHNSCIISEIAVSNAE